MCFPPTVCSTGSEFYTQNCKLFGDLALRHDITALAVSDGSPTFRAAVSPSFPVLEATFLGLLRFSQPALDFGQNLLPSCSWKARGSTSMIGRIGRASTSQRCCWLSQKGASSKARWFGVVVHGTIGCGRWVLVLLRLLSPHGQRLGRDYQPHVREEGLSFPRV